MKALVRKSVLSLSFLGMIVLICSMTKPLSNSENPVKDAKNNISVNAIKNGGKVEILWTVSPGLKAAKLVLERSKNNNRFEKVAAVVLRDDVTQEMQFAETDYKPYKGTIYYRLKQIDKSNNVTYSNVVVINNHLSVEQNNPFSNSENLSYLRNTVDSLINKQVLVVLKNTDGIEFYSKVLVSLDDSTIVFTDTEEKIAPGAYIVTASAVNLLYGQQVVVRPVTFSSSNN